MLALVSDDMHAGKRSKGNCEASLKHSQLRDTYKKVAQKIDIQVDELAGVYFG